MRLTIEEALELQRILICNIKDDKEFKRADELINKLAEEDEDDRK